MFCSLFLIVQSAPEILAPLVKRLREAEIHSNTIFKMLRKYLHPTETGSHGVSDKKELNKNNIKWECTVCYFIQKKF